MPWWVIVFVGPAFAGLVVLAVCTARLFAAIQALGGEIQRTKERLAIEHAGLKRELTRLDRTQE